MSAEYLRVRRRYAYRGDGPGSREQLDADARDRDLFLSGGPVTKLNCTETRDEEGRAVAIELERAPYLSAERYRGALGELVIGTLQLVAAVARWLGVVVGMVYLGGEGLYQGALVMWIAAGLWLSWWWRGHHDSPAERVLLLLFGLASVAVVVALITAAASWLGLPGAVSVAVTAALPLLGLDRL